MNPSELSVTGHFFMIYSLLSVTKCQCTKIQRNIEANLEEMFPQYHIQSDSTKTFSHNMVWCINNNMLVAFTCFYCWPFSEKVMLVIGPECAGKLATFVLSLRSQILMTESSVPVPKIKPSGWNCAQVKAKRRITKIYHDLPCIHHKFVVDHVLS